MWSACSWVTTSASILCGATPTASSLAFSSRQENPASSRTRAPPPSMQVAFPALPLPSTASRMPMPPCRSRSQACQRIVTDVGVGPAARLVVTPSRSVAAGVAEATGGAVGGGKLVAEDQPGARHRGDDELRDAIAAADGDRLLAEIDRDHRDLPAVIGVDRPGGVQHRQAAL